MKKTTSPKAARARSLPRAAATKPNANARAVAPVNAPVNAPAQLASFPAALPPRFYRWTDWCSFGVTAFIVLAVYLFTLAPDLTLEDAGEQAVASMYAGVPHSPGYPVWTLYTWAFTKLLPFSNIAWRVAVASAVAGALACGLIALMVSRGAGLLLTGRAEFERLEPRRRNALAVISGFVAGALMGFNGFFWSQAVIVEVYTLSVLSLTAVMACLFRWMHRPEQRRYLYLAWFLFGLCINNHQSLVVAVLAVEVCVVVGDRRLGRDLLLGNALCYVIGLVAAAHGALGLLKGNPPLLAFYHAVGLGSVAGSLWLTVKIGGLGKQFHRALGCAAAFLGGTAFYLWLPLASMGNPPMNWAYPRTVAGFIHAITRGQYERVHPVTHLGDYVQQLGQLALGAVQEFNVVYLLIGLLPLLLFKRLARRERGWVLGGLAFYLTLGPLLLVLLNPGLDRASQSLVRVFFAASHVPVAMAIGLGVTLALAWLLTSYEQVRRWAQWAAGGAVALGMFEVVTTWRVTELPLARNSALFGVTLALGVGALVALARRRAAQAALIAVLGLLPAPSLLSHWWGNEQRGHLFGYWYGHDMFTPPFQGKDGKLTDTRSEREALLSQPEGRLIYPEMPKNAVLFGGTDAGRFCPTYMIFCESFLRPEQRRDPAFDRRDVYIITQNALADAHYLEYIRAHYQRSAQRDPYFFSELLRGSEERVANYRTNLLARLALPLDRWLTGLGAKVEEQRRAAGVYPSQELQLPTDTDLQRCMSEYVMDCQARAQRGQVKPGEMVRVEGGRVEVSGQAAVMGVNALLTREIFQKNRDREFFVEESFPLDWMYPHLAPFGIIMKLNREPLAELGSEIVERDRRFWRGYMDRLIGDWITPETNIAEICTFAERVHLRRDLTGYTGDVKFLRDEQALKAFSHLRGSIGGLYDWRFRSVTGQWQQVTQQLSQSGLSAGQVAALRAEQQRLVAAQERMFKEAEFACKQAYALCPFNPEALQRLLNLLIATGRMHEALAVTETSRKFDSGNPFYTNIAAQLRQAIQTSPPLSAPTPPA